MTRASPTIARRATARTVPSFAACRHVIAERKALAYATFVAFELSGLVDGLAVVSGGRVPPLASESAVEGIAPWLPPGLWP